MASSPPPTVVPKHRVFEPAAAPFESNHRCTLCLLAFYFRNSIDSQLSGTFLDMLFTLISGESSDQDNGGLVAYPEVRVLFLVHRVRSALREMQCCPQHARPSYWILLRNHFGELSALVPDPLFLALQQLLQSLSAPGYHAPPAETHILEVELLNVVQELQRVVLSETKELSRRANTITLRYAYDFPLTTQSQ